ncbi:allograft inflammatory factor 1-like [Protopterus annectens]|uniref:allograft inflammatory factor 1-like n=1 Tax=Protopterus annectens TaxID=7888 RepID=UPI001CFC2884|nr:allograft inflammatory factor 1-like [Protopterus annectens]
MMNSAEDLQRLKKLEQELDIVNKEYLVNESFGHLSHLRGKLELLKCKYLELDPTCKGRIDILDVFKAAQDLGVSRSNQELQQMALDLTGNAGQALGYRDFVKIMLTCISTMCKRVYYTGRTEDVYQPCLLDSLSTYMELCFSGISSPIMDFPPPPPPSPADGWFSPL